MKTLFANNEIFASNFDVLTSEELSNVKGGLRPLDIDIYWEEEDYEESEQ